MFGYEYTIKLKTSKNMTNKFTMNKKTQTEAEIRKGIPVYSGFIKYFPLAILEVARLSQIGNDQHNPGKPLGWDRSKSGDELDCLGRHFIDTALDPVDTDGVKHLTKVCWRSLAQLQKELEKEGLAEISEYNKK